MYDSLSTYVIISEGDNLNDKNTLEKIILIYK